jgi:hypothetical protein
MTAKRCVRAYTVYVNHLVSKAPGTATIPPHTTTDHHLDDTPLGTYGAGDETRTRDIDLGRVALYQLSYSRN